MNPSSSSHNPAPEVPADILARINKLLRLADTSRGATPAEAQAAMAKAQQLMTEWRIEQHTLNPDSEDRAKPFNIGEDTVVMPRNQRYDYDGNVATILQKCFGVKIFWRRTFVIDSTHPSGLHHTYVFVGDSMDITMAKTVLPILLHAMRGGVTAYLKTRGEKWTARVGRAYYDGLTLGYIKGSAQGAAMAMATAKKKDADAYAIVLVDKADAITAYVANNMQIRKSRGQGAGKSGRDNDAMRAGYDAGSKLDLNMGDKLQ